jgi:hypothetical protein
MVMTMLNQLFGLKNVKTSSEQKSVRKRKPDLLLDDEYIRVGLDNLSNDNWNTDAQDALRVPILAKAHSKHFDSSNASLPVFSGSAHKSKDLISDKNPCDIYVDLDSPEEKTAQLSLVSSAPSASDLLDTTLGVYSKSVAYSCHIQALLINYDMSIRVFGPADMVALQEIGANISTWVIDLSDEEDCPVLDLLLEDYGNVSSLFLSESTLSSKCISKLNAFVQNDTLKLIA